MTSNEIERDIFEIDGVKVAVSRELQRTMSPEEVSALVARTTKRRAERLADLEAGADLITARKTLIDRYGADMFRRPK